MNELRMLEKKIVDKFGDSTWLFPSKGNVKGFYGTGLCERYNKRVMFVAERPSMGEINWGKTKETIEMFYKVLESFSLENAHLTDFIKTRAKPGQWSFEDIKENIEIFEEEIKIVKPDVVITLGQKSLGWLSIYFIMKKSSLKPYPLMHYSQRRDVKSYKDRFIKNLKEIIASW